MPMTTRRILLPTLLITGLALIATTTTTSAVAAPASPAQPPFAIRAGQVATLGGLHLVGAAVKTQRGSIRLVDNTGSTGKVGAVYTHDRVDVGSFTATLTFHIVGECSDGIALVVQDQGRNALGGPGDDIGYGRAIGGSPARTGGVHGINHSLAFMLDTWKNTWDPSVPYLSLQTRGMRQDDPQPKYSRASSPTSVVLDGANHTLSVQYDGTTVQVTYDGTQIINKALDLAHAIRLTDDTAFVGVTAANGGCAANILVTAFTVTSNP